MLVIFDLDELLDSVMLSFTMLSLGMLDMWIAGGELWIVGGDAWVLDGDVWMVEVALWMEA